MNTIHKSDDTEELLKFANKSRKESKDTWLFLELHKGDEITLCKSFNTSIQILRKNGVNYPSGWDLSVKDWQERIGQAIG